MSSELEKKYNVFLALVKGEEIFLDNLIPICEQAIEEMRTDIASSCLDFYFSRSVPKTQYFFRAFNCEALLSVPHSIFDNTGLIAMGDNFIKAMSIDKARTYQFLVFNFSIDFMEYSRFLLLPESRRYFLKPLQYISKVLEHIKDIDIEWRVILLRQLILCFNECSKKEELSKHSSLLLELSKYISTAVLRESQVFLLCNNICDSKDIKPSIEICLLSMAKRLRSFMLNASYISFSDLTQLYNYFAIHVPKDKLTFEDASLSILLTEESQTFTSNLLNMMLVIIGLVSIHNGYISLANDCLLVVQQFTPLDSESFLLLTYLLLSIKAKNFCSRIYSNSGLRKYISTISELYQQVCLAKYNRNIENMEIGASLIWNLALALFQSSFRKYIQHILFKISSILDEVGSLFYHLRSYYFRELAICEELGENYVSSEQHFIISSNYINGESWQRQLSMEISRLRMKNLLFSNSGNPVQRAIQMLNEMKSNSVNSNCREVLLEIGEILVGHSLLPFLDDPVGRNIYRNTESRDSTSLDHLEHFVDLFVESSQRIHLHKIARKDDSVHYHLLFDLMKIARQKEIWDICRCVGSFCLPFNDGTYSISSIIEQFHLHSIKINVFGDMESSHPNFKCDNDAQLLLVFAETRFVLAEGLVQLLFEKNLQLHATPELANFQLNESYTNDERWLKFCAFISILSVYAINGFISAGKMAIDLNQNWLISNCLVSFWNFTKHLYVLKKELVLFQPLRDIYVLIHSKPNIKPDLLVFKLHYAYICALFLKSQINSYISSSTSNTPLQNNVPKADLEKKSLLNSTCAITYTDKLGAESEKLLKEANEVCKISFLLIPLIKSNIKYFMKLVGVAVSILEELDQPIYLQFLMEYFQFSKELHLLKVIIFIKALSSKKREILAPEIHLAAAFNCLSSCDNANNIINLELWVTMAQLCLTEENYDMVYSCIHHGNIIGRFLLSTNAGTDGFRKIYFFLSQMECIVLFILSRSDTQLNPIDVLGQILLSFRYAKASNVLNLVLYILVTLINFCKKSLCSPGMLLMLTQEGENIISFFSQYTKLENFWLLPEDGRDIRMEVYNIFLDAYTHRSLWLEGLHFVELAQSQIPRNKHLHLLKYIVLFKSKMNLDLKADIIKVNVDMNNVTKCNHWLMGARASVPNYDKMCCYEAAMKSLYGMHSFIMRIRVTLEFVGWLVLINIPCNLLLVILEGILVDLLESIIWRFNNTNQDGDDNYLKDSINNSETKSSISTIILIFEKMEDWSMNEIDCLLQLSIMILILCGRLNHYLYTAHLQVTLFCVFSMLSIAALQSIVLKVPNQDQGKKGKGSVKSKLISGITELPDNFSQWSKFSPTLTTEGDSIGLALNFPNITLYFLNYFSKELKTSIFFRYQLFPLLLMNAISLLYKKCSRGWSRLSLIELLDYFKRFKMECPYEFWRSKLENESLVMGDRSYLDEEIESMHYLFTSERSFSVDNRFFDNSITFLTSDFIIYLGLEISKSLVVLGSIQGTIDMLLICEAYMKYFTRPIFDHTLNFLKFYILRPLFYSSDYENIYTLMLQDRYLPIDVLVDISMKMYVSLDSSLDIEFLEKYMHLFSGFQYQNLNTVFAYKKKIIELELVTRKIDFHFSRFSTLQSCKKRCIIDIEILLDSFYQYFCTFLSSQSLFDSIYAMKKCAHYMVDLVRIEGEILPFQVICKHSLKALTFHKRLIELYIRIIHCISSFSMQFDIEVDQNDYLCDQILKCLASVSSSSIDIFETLCKVLNVSKSRYQQFSQIERIIDNYAHQNESSSSIVEYFFKIGVYILYESIANLVTLQTIPFMNEIEFFISKAMISLYHFHGTDIATNWYCSNYDSVPILIICDHACDYDYENHQISKSKSMYFIVSGNKYIQKLSLLSLNSDSSQMLLKDLSYIQLSTIGVFDSKITAHYLALYQSITFSLNFQMIMSNVMVNLIDSKLSVATKFDGHFRLHSCFTRLKILPDFFNITYGMRSSFRYLVLQHSSDRKALYYSYTQQPPHKPKISKCVPQFIDWIPLVGCCKVNPIHFDDIVYMSKTFSEHQTSSSFELLSTAVQAYFNVALYNVKPLIMQEINHQDLMLFVLCDNDILSLPIEILIRNKPLNLFGMITRDFSLQLLNFRFTSSQSFRNQDNIEEKLKEVIPPQHDESDHDVFHISNTHYFISPYDCFSCLSSTNTEYYHDILKKTFALNPKLTIKWSGVSEFSNYQSSFEKWQVFKGENLLMLLSESLIAQYPLREIYSPSLYKDRNLIMIFDRMYSYNFNCFTISHPDGYYFTDIASLMSIIGGNVILTNFWPIDRERIVEKLPIFLNCLLRMGNSVFMALGAMNEDPSPLEVDSQILYQQEFSYRSNYFISYGLGYLHSI